METNKEIVIKAWEQYSPELDYKKINQIQKGHGQFHISEAQFLYSLVRHIKPKKIVECSPNEGFTTTIIMEALRKNAISSKLLSFDIHENSKRHDVPKGNINRELIVGDARKTIPDNFLKEADFILIDSDHSYDFGKWYSKKLQIAKSGTFIMIHDWPMYASDGASDNIIPEYAPPAIMQKIWNLEVLAVKQYFINKGFADPVLNVTDFLKETGKQYYHISEGTPFRALSPSQILIKK